MSSAPSRISVVIPAYNVEKYIEEALDSVFAQSPAFHEVIVVNDGSTDGTLGRIRQYADRLEVQIITIENGGLGPARNEGLRRATGEYIYFFDSDDLLDKRFMATVLLSIREHHEPDIILFSGESFHDEKSTGSWTRNLLRPFSASGLDGNRAVARLVKSGTPIPTAWLYVSKRSLWEQCQLSFKPIIHEDDDVFLPLVLSAGSVIVLQDILMYQRIRPMSIISSGKTVKNAEGLLVVVSTLTALYQNSGGRPHPTRWAIRKRAIRTAQRYMRVCRATGVTFDMHAVSRCVRITRSVKLALVACLEALVCRVAVPIRRAQR